ncbi:hypothetical protein ASG89_25945 [Paenibacillus sp. Soil766]|uniref:SGNH/GDSL hydrolase family protein n=1 Tax=Paenibacillus sp. Soil766 TaxID=1736404 RepID=UPI00070B3AD7|nr:SGNH/GDSL hydrolase family protein [Paenibacillus sp. Soil766]KRF01056.1 hypothetical protein ASG89_25945 [Paenibacillus sp. Soil766]
MQPIDMSEWDIQGAVSIERLPEGIKPWRIPYQDRALFVPNAINGKSEATAGVRVVMISNTTEIAVEFSSGREMVMDCVVDGGLLATGKASAEENRIYFTALPEGMKRIEIYLPPTRPVCLTGLFIDNDAEYRKFPDERLRWIAYGSSITQAEAAESPSQTWSAIVARQMDWNLTCIGYSANCHMETMVARMIRDMKADFISLCLGINIMGGSSYSTRTFLAAVVGFVKTIRDRHENTPILLQSPIYSRDREVVPNRVDMTLPLFREQIRDAVELLRQAGDNQLYYLDGLDVIGEADSDHLPDLLHPDAMGYKLMAERFEAAIERIPELMTCLTPRRNV